VGEDGATWVRIAAADSVRFTPNIERLKELAVHRPLHVLIALSPGGPTAYRESPQA
jgi:hypothetical protein